ncbi:Type I restriction-modification system,specificity subunit S [Pseudoalteromonas luteoviolacea B = ATCC 29581]|nr:Type I restriction-modification system,specificity subunit S [Pseudoalteromonas luteoviolacea B = ATCC 29581]
MADKWIEARLGDYVDSCLGKMLDKNKNKGDFQPYLGNSNVRWGSFELDDLAQMKFEEHENDRYGIQAGDLIICEGGEPGRCAIWEEDLPNMKIQKALHRVRAKGGLDSEYLYYWFLHCGRNGLLDAYFTGTTIKHLTGKALKELPIRIPSLDYQNKTSKLLRSFDKKIKSIHQTNQTLEQMAQALFKSWFVDFDPVIDNALAAGSDIPEALQNKAEQRKQAQQLPNFKPLPDDIRALFPSEFEQTDEPSIGIEGWIPKGWTVSSTGDEFGIHGGSTPSTKNPDFWEGGDIHWTSPKDLSGNNSKILLDTSRKITEAGLAKITSGLLPVDTVLMSSRAPVGYLALAKVPLAINQGYIALQCEKDLTPEYTMLFLESIMDEIKGISGGTTFAEISKKTFRSIKLVVPSKPAIDAYTAIAKANYDKITENIKQTNSLTETRDYLLPKLISGEITINKEVA